jgi:hypothetical protein
VFLFRKLVGVVIVIGFFLVLFSFWDERSGVFLSLLQENHFLVDTKNRRLKEKLVFDFTNAIVGIQNLTNLIYQRYEYHNKLRYQFFLGKSTETNPNEGIFLFVFFFTSRCQEARICRTMRGISLNSKWHQRLLRIIILHSL